ncbi:hypothetical protein [Paraburkholderia sp. BCC1886]|uniref:hypothetical protein n=1 Tax=Paraburkholderia sp. BCC1886 TaxID=2562670 RepID=UPI0011833EC9|nr:hypothetical protein [Paraburkholderia sp. BCC1886]
MARADLAVLAGVAILALACLFVCGLYVYWSSEHYRARLRQGHASTGGTKAIAQHEEELSGGESIMASHLSQRCKMSLYRAVAGDTHGESMVFLIAASRDDARTRATHALAAIHGVAAHNVHLHNLASFHELVDAGVSEDEDLRIFEVAWKGADVSAWAEHPLFLTDDPGLLGKWAELYADLARDLAVSAIDKARH